MTRGKRFCYDWTPRVERECQAGKHLSGEEYKDGEDCDYSMHVWEKQLEPSSSEQMRMGTVAAENLLKG